MSEHLPKAIPALSHDLHTDPRQQMRGRLVVSCQAEIGEPLYGAGHMAAMAVAAVRGGAAGIRANGPDDIAAIRQAVAVPLIGLHKVIIPGYAVRITPTLASAIAVARAGAEIIAIDATARPHPDGTSLAEYIRQIHEQTGRLVMADISNSPEGLAAQEAGADLVATTLSGYTQDSAVQENPDFDLLESLARELRLPVVAEGRIATPEQAAQALALGAWAVVVGSAITRPLWITERFVQAMVKP